jgi:broad specificity phosphatase PhoE
LADIWLMRHAAYAGHHPGHHAPPDAPLTKEGRQQVRDTLPLAPDTQGIVTSPLRRARQTAELLNHHTGLPILAVSDLLSEWRAPTTILDRTPASYPPEYKRWRQQRLDEPTSRYEDAETLAELHHRATTCAAFLSTVADEHGTILAVSHKLLLGVLTRCEGGPRVFARAAESSWCFTERRLMRQ